MRTYLTAAAAVAVVALLATGCTSTPETARPLDLTPSVSAKPSEAVVTAEPVEVATKTPTPKPSPTPEPEPEPSEDPRAGLDDETIDTLFLDLVNSTYPTMFYGQPDAKVIELAEGVCSMFDIGQTFADVVLLGVDSGYDYEEIGGFIGASIAAYCPEHENVVPE